MEIQFNFFLEKIFYKLPVELQDFFYPFLKYLVFSSFQRIFFFLTGSIVCLVLLYLFLKKKKSASPIPTNEDSLFNLISQYNFNYSYGKLIRIILHPQKNYKKFLENNDFFEKQLEKYQEKKAFSEQEQEQISQMRKKLQFNTLINYRFYKTQQLHNGVILKVAMDTKEGEINFDVKVLKNYESYFLVSYPQIKKEDYKLTTQQELSINVNIHKINYNFQTNVLDTKSEHGGLCLRHTNDIKQNVIAL